MQTDWKRARKPFMKQRCNLVWQENLCSCKIIMFILWCTRFVQVLDNLFTGFVLLFEVLEKPWDLILDFKDAWKALKKKIFVESA